MPSEDTMRMFGQAMMVRSAALSIAVVLSVGAAYAAPSVQPRVLTKEPEADQLTCGQKVLVENQTCPAGEILEVTGSCLHEKEVPGTIRRGRQFNCIPRKKSRI